MLSRQSHTTHEYQIGIKGEEDDTGYVTFRAPCIESWTTYQNMWVTHRATYSPGPVVVEGVGGDQRLQDAVHDAGHQDAYVRAEVQVKVLNQALHHMENAVKLL